MLPPATQPRVRSDFVQHSDLRRILAECARDYGASIRCPVTVASVKADPEQPSVTLTDGEVIKADVVVCADGHTYPEHIGRKVLLGAWEEKDDFEFTGLQLFKYVLLALGSSRRLYTVISTSLQRTGARGIAGADRG